MFFSNIDITFSDNFHIIIDNEPEDYDIPEDINRYLFEYIDYDFLDNNNISTSKIINKQNNTNNSNNNNKYNIHNNSNNMINEKMILTETINTEEQLIRFISSYIIDNSLNMINNNNIKIYNKIENSIMLNNHDDKLNLTSYYKKNN